MAPRGVAWRLPELRHLVELVGKHMPSTEEQWEELQELHSQAYHTNRTHTALSNKFKDLYRTKMPTGDPKMPDYILRAKEIHRDFVERTDGSVGAPNDDDDDDDSDEYSNINGGQDDGGQDGEEVDNEEDELANFFHVSNFVDGSTNGDLTTPRPLSRPLSRTSSNVAANIAPPSLAGSTNVPSIPPLPDVLGTSLSRPSATTSAAATTAAATTAAAAAAAAALPVQQRHLGMILRSAQNLPPLVLCPSLFSK